VCTGCFRGKAGRKVSSGRLHTHSQRALESAHDARQLGCVRTARCRSSAEPRACKRAVCRQQITCQQLQSNCATQSATSLHGRSVGYLPQQLSIARTAQAGTCTEDIVWSLCAHCGSRSQSSHRFAVLWLKCISEAETLQPLLAVSGSRSMPPASCWSSTHLFRLD
jgi:hypothetical protein